METLEVYICDRKIVLSLPDGKFSMSVTEARHLSAALDAAIERIQNPANETPKSFTDPPEVKH